MTQISISQKLEDQKEPHCLNDGVKHFYEQTLSTKASLSFLQLFKSHFFYPNHSLMQSSNKHFQLFVKEEKLKLSGIFQLSTNFYV